MELRDDLRDATSPGPELPSPRMWQFADAYDRGKTEIKRRCWIGAAAMAIVVASLIAFSVGVRAVHPRDEADFLLAADQLRSVDVIAPGDEGLIREGDFACRWLDQQGRANWNHGPWYDREGVLDRYTRQTRPVLPGEWGVPAESAISRSVVAEAAWSQLCGGTWWWHRPHGPRGWGGSGGGGWGDDVDGGGGD